MPRRLPVPTSSMFDAVADGAQFRDRIAIVVNGAARRDLPGATRS